MDDAEFRKAVQDIYKSHLRDLPAALIAAGVSWEIRHPFDNVRDKLSRAMNSKNKNGLQIIERVEEVMSALENLKPRIPIGLGDSVERPFKELNGALEARVRVRSSLLALSPAPAPPIPSTSTAHNPSARYLTSAAGPIGMSPGAVP